MRFFTVVHLWILKISWLCPWKVVVRMTLAVLTPDAEKSFLSIKSNKRGSLDTNSFLGGGFNPFEKYARQNGFIFPKFRGENKTYLKPPPSFCKTSESHGKNFTLSILIFIFTVEIDFYPFSLVIISIQPKTAEKKNPQSM